MNACARCGTDNADDAHFCQRCGAALDTSGGTADARKTVTILFADVSGSTELGETLDAERLRAVMHRYFTVARAAVETHGGIVEKFIGDAVMAVFGVPTVHEDDASRAARAAVDVRAAVEQLNADLLASGGTGIAVRIGVNTGGGDRRRLGDARVVRHGRCG